MSNINLPIEAIDGINHIKEVCDRLKPLVAIDCITYNHEPYIRDALEGFVMQKANFQFVAIVHEDASTDNTAEIIREYAEEYPDIILPIYERENQYKTNLGSIMQTAREATGAKYIAYCEGDDYWTDPLKLQKQVDFLESHQDYALVCSNYDKLYQESNEFIHEDSDRREIKFEELIIHNLIATLTVLIKSEILFDYANFIWGAPKWPFGDYSLWLYASAKSKVFMISDVTAVYRVLRNSASHITDDAAKLRWAHSEFSMFDFFNCRFKIPKISRIKSLFFKCHNFTPLAVQTGDLYLKNRIKEFYLKNHFYIAWLSFKILQDLPKLKPLSNYIEKHLFIKAPIYYLFK